MEKRVIEFNQKVEEVVNKNMDLIENQARELQEQYSITSCNELKKDIHQLLEDGRLLKIGIIGRVKAGKSSLLNSLLFKGESILPKAATPMTAALTVISYGEKFGAEVEFYSASDIEIIKKEAFDYKTKFKSIFSAKYNKLKEKGKIKDEEELKTKATKQAKNEMKENIKLTASFEQYQQMEKSGLFEKIKTQSEKIQAENIEDLKNSLGEYVGATGKYMPFTKSIHIQLPVESLKELEIIDTPGINDPVVSREERTRKLLKSCDVIYVVSPAGQFISEEDKELMDRISTREGVNEVFVIASQADNQLFGSEKDKYNGELPKVLKAVGEILDEHLVSTIKKLKEDSPEIGDVFDKLLEGNKVFLTSGISHSIKMLFHNREKWDEGMEHVWNNLKEEYGAYFSEDDFTLTENSLDTLSNISQIDGTISDVKGQKEKILEEKKEKFLSSKLNNLKNYKESLVLKIDEKIEYLQKANLDELRKQKIKIEKNRENLKETISEVYEEAIDELEENTRDNTGTYLTKEQRRISDTISSSEGTTEEAYTRKSSGWGAKFSRFFGTGGYETDYRTVNTLMVTGIRNGLEELTRDIQFNLQKKVNIVFKSFKRELPGKIVVESLKIIDDGNVDGELLSVGVKKILRNLKQPEFNEELELPSYLKSTGMLKGYEATMYMDNATSYLSDLINSFSKKVSNYVHNLNNNLKKYDPVEDICNSMSKEVEKIIKELENKEVTLERLNKIKEELKGVNINE